MRARRTDAPRKTAITMAVMAPGPSTPGHTKRGCGRGVWGGCVNNPTREFNTLINEDLLCTFFLAGWDVGAVRVVEGEGLPRHVLERVFGDDVTWSVSRYGVLVVPGYCHRLCRQRMLLNRDTGA